jgi:RecA/RadA recombinase
MLTQPRLTVLVGNYGSGKTEIALNLAMEKAKTGPAALVDLDIVNPYFRSGEKRALLEEAGVRVLMPTFATTTVDIPALPPEIQSVFDQPGEQVVFDVGGDDTGATALGRYAPFFSRERENTCVLYVVNVCRPLSRTAEDIQRLMERISFRSRMRPDVLVNNANLQGETLPKLLLEGQEVLSEVSQKTGIPIAMITGEQAVLGMLPNDLKPLIKPIIRYMRPEWMDE